ncbi:MAG: hypothetical protein CR963_00105 [Gammaproteobacteria bacterium]|nr:MAG: hypothetical protein CR963_00105 [Gammaproteobacteria bacterium]
MEFYLRVEGVNLGNFVYDTSDLATIRGGSLLLLDAMDIVEEEIITHILQPKRTALQKQLDHCIAELNKVKREKTRLKEEKNRLKKDLKKGIGNYTITKGASWGLFKFQAGLDEALVLEKAVKDRFNNDNQYKHACFVVNVYSPEQKNETYQVSRAKVQTLNRRQQLMEPSIAISLKGNEACAIDKIRPSESKEHLPGTQEKDYISKSVSVRREYGKDVKKSGRFYSNRTNNSRFSNLSPTKDLSQLCHCKNNLHHSHLKNKMAFIYIDGNEFGKKQQRCKDSQEQRMFDRRVREGRDHLLNALLLEITRDNTDEKWFNGQLLRLETLLWGGDEIIWVVPAWQGWWMLKRFYQLANQHIYLESKNGNREDLYHGASIVFCKHKTPIRTIDSLARKLADNFAKTKGLKKKNMVAYQILESFDHAGANISEYRRMLIDGLSENDQDLLIPAEEMQNIENGICELKALEFPRRKIHQIVHCYRNENSCKAAELIKKICNESPHDSDHEKKLKQNINRLLDQFKTIFTNSPVFWIHLLELWDYVGFEPVESGLKEEV